jgi:hypothetical protein
MSNYTKTTNFTAKDALLTGDPNKLVKGSDMDTEFDNIETASATKANKISGGTTGQVVEQDSNGDLVDTGLATPTGAFVGESDTQTLTNKTLTSPVINTGVSGTAILDEDTMSTDSSTQLATQQSIKAYVDTEVAAITYSLQTAATTTSGTAHGYTSIPSTATKIYLMFNGVSTDGTESIIIQIGDSGGYETTGYTSLSCEIDNGPFCTAETTGFICRRGIAAGVISGLMTLTLMDSSANTWVISGNLGDSNSSQSNTNSGVKSLSATLDRVQLTSTGTPDTFDAGSFNIAYE